MAKAKTNTEDYLRMYRQMMRIRTFEDNANQRHTEADPPRQAFSIRFFYATPDGVGEGPCQHSPPT